MILITKDGKVLSKARETEFKNELYLQEYLSENPELVPLEEIYLEEREFIITLREFGTYSGPIDILAIDNKGDIYIIETKLSKNADKRRVIAQILDYAAALWDEYSSNPEVFINSIGKDIDIPEDVIENVSRNISDGNFKLIVAMDSLDRRLKTLIRFLKVHSAFDIYALEFDHYEYQDERGEKYEIFVPKLFGTETTEKKTSSQQSSRRKWTIEEFLEYIKTEVTEQDPHKAEAILKIYYKAEEIGWRIRPGTSKWGSISLIPPGDISKNKAIINISGTGFLKIYPDYFIDEKLKEEFLHALILAGIPVDTTKKELHLKPEQWIPKINELISLLERFA